MTVSGAFNWTAGTLTGGGSMTISDTAAVGGWVTLDDFVLINTGTITWAGGLWIYFYNGAGIDNQAAGSFLIDTASGTSSLGYGGASAGTFTNAGTVTKSGAGTTQFNVPFTNRNAVDINGGTLILGNSSTHTGSFAVAAGQTLQISGNHSFEAVNVLSGSGSLVVSGTASFPEAFDTAGAVTITGNSTFGAGADFIDLTLSGTLSSSGAVTVSGAFNWTAGTLTGGGSMTISDTAAVGGWVTLDDFDLINTGTITWAGGLWIYFYNGAGIDNQAAGSFLIDTASGTSSLGYGGASAGIFTNAGTLTKSGAGTVTFNVPFTNSNAVDINGGTLALASSSTHTGSFAVAAGQTPQISAITGFEAVNVLSGSGSLVVSGTASFPEAFDTASAVTITGNSTFWRSNT